MEFFNSAIEVLQTLVIALGAGLAVWGAINLDMFGINHAITQPNMLKTAKQMVKDNLNEKSVVKGDSAEAFQSSFLRPTRIGDNSIKGVDYSTYYYEDGNYYFDVLYNGDIFKNVKLGKHFPEKATISIWKYDNWDEIGRQSGYLPAIYASQGFETYTSQSLGDPEGLVIPYAPRDHPTNCVNLREGVR